MPVERKILNDRFIKIYDQLVEDGKVLPDSSGSNSLTAFAENIGTERQAIGLWLSRQVYIPYEQAFKLCQVYEIPEDYMFKDITNVFDLVTQRVGNIIWIEEIEFFCGEGDFVIQNKKFRRFDDPSVNGEFWAFKASGDSMEKTIHSGDTVYAKKLEKPDYLKLDEVCAIATVDKAMMKRVKEKRYDKNNGKLTYLILVSDNKKYPKTIKVAAKDIIYSFKVEEVRSKNLEKRV